MSKPLNLNRAERELIVTIGSRWMNKSIDEILNENAVLFRLAVAIVGLKCDRERRPARRRKGE